MTTSLSRVASVPTAAAPTSVSLLRAFLVALVAGAAVGGLLVGGPESSARAALEAGPELTRLLRGMALLKSLLGAGALAGVLFRLGAAVSRARFTLYALAAAAMAGGASLVWRMDHLRAGAVFLHAGLLLTVVMLFRDPAIGALLQARIAARAKPDRGPSPRGRSATRH